MTFGSKINININVISIFLKILYVQIIFTFYENTEVLGFLIVMYKFKIK